MEARYNRLEQQLREYIGSYPFDQLAILLDYLEHLDAYLETKEKDDEFDVDEVIALWNLNCLSLISKWGGTNCVGATQYFLEMLDSDPTFKNTRHHPVVSQTEGYGEDSSIFSHSALVLYDEEAESYILLDPGFRIVTPLILREEHITDAVGRNYVVSNQGDQENTPSGFSGSFQLSITTLKGKKRNLKFWLLPEKSDLNEIVQKPLFRTKKVFKIETSDINGLRNTSLQIDFFLEKISLMNRKGEILEYSFEEVDKLFRSPNFISLEAELNYTEMSLKERIKLLIERKNDVVNMWTEEIRKEYYLLHNDKLA